MSKEMISFGDFFQYPDPRDRGLSDEEKTARLADNLRTLKALDDAVEELGIEGIIAEGLNQLSYPATKIDIKPVRWASSSKDTPTAISGFVVPSVSPDVPSFITVITTDSPKHIVESKWLPFDLIDLTGCVSGAETLPFVTEKWDPGSQEAVRKVADYVMKDFFDKSGDRLRNGFWNMRKLPNASVEGYRVNVRDNFQAFAEMTEVFTRKA